MNVIMIAPGYPGEMPYFCRALALHGARVYGLSDVPEKELPALAGSSCPTRMPPSS